MLDETKKNTLEGFADVWKRVSGREKAAESEHERLEGFIENAARAAELYCLLARRMSGCAQELRQLAAEERRTRRCMEGEHFLLTGDSFCPAPACPVVHGCLSALRQAYLGELASAGAYREAAKAECGTEREALYLKAARTEERHADCLRSLAMKSI